MMNDRLVVPTRFFPDYIPDDSVGLCHLAIHRGSTRSGYDYTAPFALLNKSPGAGKHTLFDRAGAQYGLHVVPQEDGTYKFHEAKDDEARRGISVATRNTVIGVCIGIGCLVVVLGLCCWVRKRKQRRAAAAVRGSAHRVELLEGGQHGVSNGMNAPAGGEGLPPYHEIMRLDQKDGGQIART